MTTHKIKGKFVFECDECGESCDTGKRDFAEALDVMKSEGWRAVRATDGEWEHYCPDC